MRQRRKNSFRLDVYSVLNDCFSEKRGAKMRFEEIRRCLMNYSASQSNSIAVQALLAGISERNLMFALVSQFPTLRIVAPKRQVRNLSSKVVEEEKKSSAEHSEVRLSIPQVQTSTVECPCGSMFDECSNTRSFGVQTTQVCNHGVQTEEAYEIEGQCGHYDYTEFCIPITTEEIHQMSTGNDKELPIDFIEQSEPMLLMSPCSNTEERSISFSSDDNSRRSSTDLSIFSSEQNFERNLSALDFFSDKKLAAWFTTNEKVKNSSSVQCDGMERKEHVVADVQVDLDLDGKECEDNESVLTNVETVESIPSDETEMNPVIDKHIAELTDEKIVEPLDIAEDTFVSQSLDVFPKSVDDKIYREPQIQVIKNSSLATLDANHSARAPETESETCISKRIRHNVNHNRVESPCISAPIDKITKRKEKNKTSKLSMVVGFLFASIFFLFVFHIPFIAIQLL